MGVVKILLTTDYTTDDNIYVLCIVKQNKHLICLMKFKHILLS